MRHGGEHADDRECGVPSAAHVSMERMVVRDEVRHRAICGYSRVVWCRPFLQQYCHCHRDNYLDFEVGRHQNSRTWMDGRHLDSSLKSP